MKRSSPVEGIPLAVARAYGGMTPAEREQLAGRNPAAHTYASRLWDEHRGRLEHEHGPMLVRLWADVGHKPSRVAFVLMVTACMAAGHDDYEAAHVLLDLAQDCA